MVRSFLSFCLVGLTLSQPVWAPHRKERDGAGPCVQGAASALAIAAATGVQSDAAQEDDQDGHLLGFPPEVWGHIFRYLGPADLACFRQTCRRADALVGGHTAHFSSKICHVLPIGRVYPLACANLTCRCIPADDEQRARYAGLIQPGLRHLDLSASRVFWPHLLDFLTQLRESDKLPTSVAIRLSKYKLLAIPPEGEVGQSDQARRSTYIQQLATVLAGVHVSLEGQVWTWDNCEAFLNAAEPPQLATFALFTDTSLDGDENPLRRALEGQGALTALNLIEGSGSLRPLITAGCWDNVKALSVAAGGCSAEDFPALCSLPSLERLAIAARFMPLATTHCTPQFWQQLKALELDGTDAMLPHISPFLDALSQASNLTSLTLDTLHLPGDQWGVFVRCLGALEKLDVLEIRSVFLDPSVQDKTLALGALGDVLKARGLSTFRAPSSLLAAAPQGFFGDVFSRTTMRALILSDSRDHTGDNVPLQAARVMPALRMCHQITSLTLAFVDQVNLLACCAGTMPFLKQLDIREADETIGTSDPADWQRLFQALRGCPHLEQLKLSGLVLEPGGLRALASLMQLNTLSDIAFVFGAPTPWAQDEVHPFLQALPHMTRLQRIRLARCDVRPAGGEQLAEILPRLPRLADAYFIDLPIGRPAMEGIIQALASDPGRPHISFARCQVEGGERLSREEVAELQALGAENVSVGLLL